MNFRRVASRHDLACILLSNAFILLALHLRFELPEPPATV